MSQRQNIKIWWLWIYFGCKLHTLLCVLPSLFFLVIFLCLTQDKSKIYYWTTEWFLIWFPSWKNELGRPKQHTRGKEIILSPSLLCFLPPKMLFLFLCLFLHSECCVVTVSILVMGCLVVVEFADALFISLISRVKIKKNTTKNPFHLSMLPLPNHNLICFSFLTFNLFLLVSFLITLCISFLLWIWLPIRNFLKYDWAALKLSISVFLSAHVHEL